MIAFALPTIEAIRARLAWSVAARAVAIAILCAAIFVCLALLVHT